MKRLRLLAFILSTLPYLSEAKQLIVYGSIPGRLASDQFSCRVREEGSGEGGWRKAFVIKTTCKNNPLPKSPIQGPEHDNGYFSNFSGWTASYIAVEFEGLSIEVEITKTDSPITKAMVRPTADAPPARISGGKAYVTLSKPANVNVDVNGQMEDRYTGQGYEGPAIHTLSIFASPVYPPPTTGRVLTLQPDQDIRKLDRDAWDAIQFAPGVHDIGKAFEIRSNEILYLPGDAIVHGTIHPAKANSPKDWQVYGSGAISGEKIDCN